MPVSYSDMRRYNIPPDELFHSCRNACEKLNGAITYEGGGYLITEVPYCGGSLPVDVITLYIHHEFSAVLVTSENRHQDYDAGRNRKRVEDFFTALETLIVRLNQKPVEP